jgi:DNA-binding CsgD family transcriptional regulator
LDLTACERPIWQISSSPSIEREQCVNAPLCVRDLAYREATVYANTFVEAVRQVRDEAERLGIIECKIELTFDTGEAALAVEFGHPQPLPHEVERTLQLLVSELSVWCTDHGITPKPEGAVQLTARQYEIGELASRGLTNIEIADTLGISINTVKVRLKQVFARLNASNRTELSHLLRRTRVAVTRR